MDNNMEEKSSAAPVKEKKIRKHPVLGKPVLGCILLTFWGLLFYMMFGQTVGMILAQITGSDGVAELAAMVGGLLVLLFHWLWFRPEFGGYVCRSAWKSRRLWLIIGIWIAVELVLEGVDYASNGFAGPSFSAFASALMAGVSEEAAFRALGVSVMMRRYKDGGPVKLAAFLTGIIFGVIHLLNVTSGEALSLAIPQVVFACGAGIFFASIYLRTGNILVTMVIHFVYDFLTMMAVETDGAAMTTADFIQTLLVQCAIAIFEIALSIWMLKGHDEEIRALWRTIWHTPEAAAQDAETAVSADAE